MSMDNPSTLNNENQEVFTFSLPRFFPSVLVNIVMYNVKGKCWQLNSGGSSSSVAF